MRLSRRSFLKCAALSLGAAGVTYSYLETLNIGVTRLNFGLGSKAAFMVDTHTHEFGIVEERVVDILDKECPEVVLHGGDFIDIFTRSLKPLREYLSLLNAGEKYAVLGNHDYWSGKTDELVRLLKDLGFRVLKDQAVKSAVGLLLGVDWRDDRAYEWMGYADVVFAHDPNAVEAVAGGKLTLAGHTHGGVVVGGLTLFTNSLYTRGLYEIRGGRPLYVSRGLGQMWPLRPTSPLEIVLIE